VVWPLEMMAWVDAAERRSQEWLGILPGTRRLTVHPVVRDVPRWRRLKRTLRNNLRTDLSSLANGRAYELIEALAHNPPAVIVGSTPGAICELARALDGPWPFPTSAVVTSGTRLHEHQRALIERVFGCPAYERYGSIETGLLSHPCREGGAQHVTADVVLFEVVRDDGSPAAPDEVGHVLVTVLRNRAMPLIRYRTGDLASLSAHSCSCGRGLPVLERLVGRTIEKLVTADGGTVVPEVAVHAVLDIAEESLLEFKIVQQDDRRVHLLVVQRDNPDPEAVRARLAETFDMLVGLPGTTVVERVPRIPLEPTGKLNVLVSHAVER
jgi:phenylacetate-CoA ligase